MEFGTPTRPIKILVVEDNPADVRLLMEALKDATVPNDLHVAETGRAALDLLFGRSLEGAAFAPDIVLLDLNLPDVDGQDILKSIKSHPNLRRMPVVILTTSHEERDISESYRRYANSYITKPTDYNRFIRVVRTIEEFWLATARLPRGVA